MTNKKETASSPHLTWLKKERPQTFAALQPSLGDSEDLKSCCARLEGEVKKLNDQLNLNRKAYKQIEQGKVDLRNQFVAQEDDLKKLADFNKEGWKIAAEDNDNLKKEIAELKDRPITVEMLEIAKTEDLYHFAGNLNAILKYGYCKKCKLTPNGCIREGCGEEGSWE